MAGSTIESVGASTAEISGVFGRGVVENGERQFGSLQLSARCEVKCAGRRGGGYRRGILGSVRAGRGVAARGAARGAGRVHKQCAMFEVFEI